MKLLDALLPDGCMGTRDDMTDYRERICNRSGQVCEWPQDRPTHQCPAVHEPDWDRMSELARDARDEGAYDIGD
jgi:hypothetical protein